MKPNPGYCPAEAAGRRVNVLLANGNKREWPADGKNGCVWRKRGLPVDIDKFEVIR